MSKYRPLWEYLKENEENSCILSFEQIGSILGYELDHSFLRYKKEATEYGFEVGKISLKEKTVVFRKIK